MKALPSLKPGPVAAINGQASETVQGMPVKVTAFYQQKLEEEWLALGHADGPLRRIVIPPPCDIEDAGCEDFNGDRLHMPSEGGQKFFIHKYPDRVLLMPTLECFSNCRYCFRHELLQEGKASSNPLPDLATQGRVLAQYLRAHPEVQEVILSGGDPLMLPAAGLETLLGILRRDGAVRHFRLHTKGVVFQPAAATAEKIAVLKKYGVRVVFHVTHPYELCTVVRDLISHMLGCGLRLYNQFPLLRKINDHSSVLIKLLRDLDELGVRNLSIFFPDVVRHSSAYRIPFHRLFRIMDEVSQNSPAWVNSTRFCQDTAYGKVRRDDMLSLVDGVAVFRRGDRLVRVPDFPEHLDEPGELKTLLWKG